MPTKVKQVKQEGILLTPEDINRIKAATGGGIFKTGSDIALAMEKLISIKVDGVEVTLAQEDAQSLKDRYDSTGYKDYNKYIVDNVNEALCAWLWGSTRGILSW